MPLYYLSKGERLQDLVDQETRDFIRKLQDLPGDEIEAAFDAAFPSPKYCQHEGCGTLACDRFVAHAETTAYEISLCLPHLLQYVEQGCAVSVISAGAVIIDPMFPALDPADLRF